MKFISKQKLAIALVAGIGLTTSAQANTPINAQASVTVNGAITLVKAADMNFGEIIANDDNTNGGTATLALSPLEGAANPLTATNDGLSTITVIGGTPAPAKFTITGAGANASVIVTTDLGTGLTSLTNGANPAAAALTIGSPTIYDVTNASFRTFTAGDSDALTTDGNGDLEFNMGATITLPAAIDGAVPDGTYNGTFTVVANYQ
ncbi:DUF4402 domain-containing protein [Thiomicrorhabdus indica]|uniref:DUF4402 domain-containing protein n=1 Tax=Thiomicrorhabdus indica TaxID=2267253 RepID=UPI00102E068E|nr:DUF4402 domain-containing protein [Thiomicrorhabdus indica]